jgi:response regulator RpfG family c-di-GMP phosphodiesterase
MNNHTLDLEGGPAHSRELLQTLVRQCIVLAEDMQQMNSDERNALMVSPSIAKLVEQLLARDLITRYVADRILKLQLFGLVLGNYRVLDQLGVGGMGVVFKAEHIRLRRPVAIKVMSTTTKLDSRLLTRFYAETRAVAQIQHPNIVAPIDVGECFSTDALETPLHYFVMEFVPGKDLEWMVHNDGPMLPAKASAVILQIAEALAEAHRNDLIHRDIKPSNILVTDDEQAKLLDFGLARHFTKRLTDPGAILGTIGYMAPEQAKDAAQVDSRADIYSLGATLFWCVTGRDPFPSSGQTCHDLAARLTQEAPSARHINRQVPAGLDLVIGRMMALNPEQRYPTALAVTRALIPFLKSRGAGSSYDLQLMEPGADQMATSMQCAFTRRVLIVEDEAPLRELCRQALLADGMSCHEASTGQETLEMLQSLPFDLLLLDVQLPDCEGTELVQRIRSLLPQSRIKIVLMSGLSHGDDMAEMLLRGVDDFVAKPFTLVQLRTRIRSALRQKERQERSDMMQERLLTANAELEQSLSMQELELANARQMLVQVFSQMIVRRGVETATHLKRVQAYCRWLGAAYASAHTNIPGLDETWLNALESAAPLHDVGMFTLPDHILLKPGKFDADEYVQLQAHTIAGAEILQALADQNSFARSFLLLGAEIARSHHERFDGTGYPENRKGHDIPLSARILGLADVYDALRSRGPCKPSLSHRMAMTAIYNGQHEQFDPDLLDICHKNHDQLDTIYHSLTHEQQRIG